MGSSGKTKTKTLRNIQGTPLFDTSKNLYRLKLLRSLITSGFNPTYISFSMSNDIHNFTDYVIPKAFGFTSKIPLVTHQKSDSVIKAYIKNNINNDIKCLIGLSTDHISSFNAIEYLKEKYTYDTSTTKEFKHLVSSYIYGGDTDSDNCPKRLVDTDTGDGETTDKTVKIYSPIIVIDGINYFPHTRDNSSWVDVYTDDDGNYKIKLIELDSDNNETDIYKEIDYYDDKRSDLTVWFNTNSDPSSNNRITIFTSKVTNEVNTYNTLMIQIKNNYELLSNDKLFPLLNKYGISRKYIQDSFNDSSLNDVMITYFGSVNGIFKKWIKDTYTVNNIVEINNGYTDIKYYYELETDPNDEANKIPVLKIFVNGIDASENEYLINNRPIPLNLIKDLKSLPDKYKAIKECFSTIVYAEKTIKLKWYQTAIFNIAVHMAAIYIAAFTGNIESYAIANIILGITNTLNISKQTKLAIKTTVIIYLGTEGSINTETSYVTEFVQMLPQISNIYFMYESMKYQNDINKYKKQLNDEEEKLKGINKNINFLNVYTPLDNINNYYSTIYSVQYDILSKCSSELPQLNYKDLYE